MENSISVKEIGAIKDEFYLTENNGYTLSFKVTDFEGKEVNPDDLGLKCTSVMYLDEGEINSQDVPSKDGKLQLNVKADTLKDQNETELRLFFYGDSDNKPSIIKNFKIKPNYNNSSVIVWDYAIEIGKPEDFGDEFYSVLKGAKGSKGDKGEKGDKGDTGAKGEQGIQGIKGEKGERGQEGKSAYEVAVANGFIGSETDWLAKLDGLKPKDTVATFNDLPKDAEIKELRGVTDENAVYVYDGTKWIKQLQLNLEDLEDVKKNIFYKEIVTRSYRDEVSSTDYWVTIIPFQDENGEKIEVKKGTTENEKGETPREFFEKMGASFVVNASLFNSTGLYGKHIKDGEVYKDTTAPYEILGITKEREFKFFPANTPTATLLSDGVENSFVGFCSILKGGNDVPAENYNKIGSYAQKHPRLFIGINENKDLYVVVTDGRKKNSIGMDYADIIRIAKALNLKEAYSLDGGGSAQAIHNGNFIGGLIDNDLTTERKVYDFLYIPKKANREIDSQVNTIAENSVRLKKLENNSIDRRNPVFENNAIFEKESTFKAKSYFEDFVYINEGRAIFNKSADGEVSRLFGTGVYNYLGSVKKDLQIETKGNLTVSIGGALHTVNLIPNNPVWKTPEFMNSWKSEEARKGKYIKVGDTVTITGYFLGTAGNFTKAMFYIDEGYRPKQQVTFPVHVTGGSKEYNTLIVNPSGAVYLAYDIANANDKSGVQVHVSYTIL